MSCSRFAAELALFPVLRREADLPAPLLGHADACAACGRRLHERIRLDALLDAAGPIEPPADLVARAVAAAHRGDRTGPRRLVPFWTKFAAALVIAATLVLAVLLSEPDRRSGTAVPESAAVAPAEPELLRHLDLLLDDWEEVHQHEDALELLVGLEVATALDALDEEAETPR